MDGWMNGWMDGWMDRWMDKWTDGLTDEPTDHQTDRWMENGLIHFHALTGINSWIRKTLLFSTNKLS